MPEVLSTTLTASPARLTMGPGTWAVSVAARDVAGNSSSATQLAGVVTIVANAGVTAPSPVQLVGAPWHNVNWTTA